jgi:hypothetical protein
MTYCEHNTICRDVDGKKFHCDMCKAEVKVEIVSYCGHYTICRDDEGRYYCSICGAEAKVK